MFISQQLRWTNPECRLAADTGSSNSDRLTNNPAITGSVNDPQGSPRSRQGSARRRPSTFWPIVKRTVSFYVSPSLAWNRSTADRLPMDPHTPHAAGDGHRGNVTQTTVPFTLDTVVPSLTLESTGLGQRADRRPTDDQRQCRTGRADGSQRRRSNCWARPTTTANATASSPSPMWRSRSGPMRSPCEPPTPPGISGVRLKLLHESVLGRMVRLW